MTLTSHGHHIPGSTRDDEQNHPMVHRCGGPDLCDTCGRESSMWRHPSNQKNQNKAPDVDESVMRRNLRMVINDLGIAEGVGEAVSVGEIRDRLELISNGEGPCPRCSGPVRQTINMKCPECGTDYS